MTRVRFLRGKVARRLEADSLEIVYLRSLWPLDWTERPEEALVLSFEDAVAVAAREGALALGIPLRPGEMACPRVSPEMAFADLERRRLA